MELRGEHRVNYSLTFECHTSIFEGCFSNELAAGCWLLPGWPQQIIKQKVFTGFSLYIIHNFFNVI
jgi:hypothetical protein